MQEYPLDCVPTLSGELLTYAKQEGVQIQGVQKLTTIQGLQDLLQSAGPI